MAQFIEKNTKEDRRHREGTPKVCTGLPEHPEYWQVAYVTKLPENKEPSKRMKGNNAHTRPVTLPVSTSKKGKPDTWVII